MKKTLILLCTLAVCASAIVCALILVKPSVLFKHEGSIRVKGTASTRVQADVATWSAKISTAAPTREEAFQNMKSAQEIYREFLAERGVRADDCDTYLSAWHVCKKNEKGYDTNEIEKFCYSWRVSLETHDMEQLKRLVNEAPMLIEKGVEIDVDSPDYYYTNLDALKLELLAKASENAKERAQLLIAGSGSRLGKVVSAAQGVFQITPLLSTATSDYGMYDTSSYEKRVQCVVTLEFEAEK